MGYKDIVGKSGIEELSNSVVREPTTPVCHIPYSPIPHIPYSPYILSSTYLLPFSH